MCYQCVTPVHLGIKGLSIFFILGSVHNVLGPGRSHLGRVLRAGTRLVPHRFLCVLGGERILGVRLRSAGSHGNVGRKNSN